MLKKKAIKNFNKFGITLEKKIEPKKNFNSEKDKEADERKLLLWRIVTNIILSLILIINFFLMWSEYTPVWKIFFFLTIWSFWSNTFYIITITIIDIFLYCGNKKVEKYNNFIRNDFVRIIFPFSVSTVIIYWELVLLGDKFQGIGHSVLEICKSFFMHGLVLLFMLFDLFTSHHLNKKNNYKIDITIISIIMALHFGLVVISKEFLKVHPYDFLMICDTRQMIGSFIIIYVIVLNGYAVLYLISDNFFSNEENNNIPKKKQDEENNEKEDKKEEMNEKYEKGKEKKENEKIEVREEVKVEQEEKFEENKGKEIDEGKNESNMSEQNNKQEKNEEPIEQNKENKMNEENIRKEENFEKDNLNKKSLKSLAEKSKEQLLSKNKKRNLHIIINKNL